MNSHGGKLIPSYFDILIRTQLDLDCSHIVKDQLWNLSNLFITSCWYCVDYWDMEVPFYCVKKFRFMVQHFFLLSCLCGGVHLGVSFQLASLKIFSDLKHSMWLCDMCRVTTKTEENFFSWSLVYWLSHVIVQNSKYMKKIITFLYISCVFFLTYLCCHRLPESHWFSFREEDWYYRAHPKRRREQ